MKFSRFKFSVLLNVIILTQPVNQALFSFSSSFYKIDGKFSALLFCDSLIIISNCIRLVKNIFKLFSNFFIPADPLPRGCERKVCLLSSDSLSILPPLLPFVKYPFRVFSQEFGITSSTVLPRTCTALICWTQSACYSCHIS